jgi:serine/threonine protein kinase
MNALKQTFVNAHVGIQFGNYRIIRSLGQGGLAHVLLGKHIYLETRAAIKILKMKQGQEDFKKLRMEANVLARMNHPHIVRLHEFGIRDSQPFLVMDYAPYGNLRQQYPERQPLPSTTVVRYVKQIASALQYMHDRGWIHQDVKPENMLVLEHDHLLLSDFGIALHERYADIIAAKARYGTAAYMAPEQLCGIPCLASDQYALAVVIYEWLCGELPFRGSSQEIAYQHISAPLPSLRAKVPTLSPRVEDVVQKALAKDPKHRFESVREFVEKLEQSMIKSPVRYSIFPLLTSRII